MEKSNLSEMMGNTITESHGDFGTTKSELAELVDRQLEVRRAENFIFDEKEVKRTLERELLGPKFYKGVLEECGLDLWMVFKYAVHYLFDETGALAKEKQPAIVKELFTILTGEADFMAAVQIFFVEVFPTHAMDHSGITPVFRECCKESYEWHPLQPIKEYFAYELTDEKLRKLEVLLENADAMKQERFILGDRFVERQEGNMERIRRLREFLGDDSKESVFPLLLNELRVNPSDIFRYFFHRDLAVSMIWGGRPGTYNGGSKIKGRIPMYKSEGFEEFLKITGVVSYNEENSNTAKPTNTFWTELQKAVGVSLDDMTNQGFFGFKDVETGYRGWKKVDVVDPETTPHAFFYNSYYVEDPMYLISSYGAEATMDRLDAIFTPEVLEVIRCVYGGAAAKKKEPQKSKKKGLFGFLR